MTNSQDNNRFKDTLNLPTTSFPLRAHAQETSAAIRARWDREDIYAVAYENPDNKPTYVMHDGPPYANGHIHMGTAFNKVLKDIVCKYKRMSGFFVPFRPGWDCHGLPIELKSSDKLKTSGVEGETVDLSSSDRLAIMAACRATAISWYKVQRDEFKALGVIAAWAHPYMTMDPAYEAEIVRAFGIFAQKGYIMRKHKTVPWCASCKTALATAEIEYHDRKDPSCFVLFRLSDYARETLCAPLFKMNPDLRISLLVWTTTPWTLPLNRAVVLNPKARYVLLQGADHNEAFFVARERADAICTMLGIQKNILLELDASAFATHMVQHPIDDTLLVPMLHSDIVTLDDGTACMHMAPGCGPEDYQLAIAQGIEVYSPLAANGTYTVGIVPAELEGMSVTDGQIWVMRKLTERGTLLYKTSIRHSYPHCWRCRNGLMFRATQQWFCDLQKNNLVERSLVAIESMTFVPTTGRARLSATIKSRAEWCISRQRVWGTPIVAILCTKCEVAILDIPFINKVAEGIAHEGIEYWQRLTLDEIIARDMLSKPLQCDSCGNDDRNHFVKERDILDVWFDSGVSHFAVLDTDPQLRAPADVYLEGSDQHRGWFQSSLLTSMVLRDAPCARTIVTHGYVVDAHGHKMSKSLGNVVAPEQVIAEYSADILRLWVSSVDATNDMVLSGPLLKNVAEVYRKIRNTMRFLLSNLYDFDPVRDTVALHEMLPIDQYACARLHEITTQILTAYEAFEIASVYHTISTYCASDLSAFVLDVMKDRLYVERADGILRRSAQTACYALLDTLTRLVAPLLSFLAEEVSDYYQKDKTTSIHLQEFVQTIDVWHALSAMHNDAGLPAFYRGETVQDVMYGITLQGQWNALCILRDLVLKALEHVRAAGLIRHSLEAKVTLWIDGTHAQGGEVLAFLQDLRTPETPLRFLKELFIVSQVSLLSEARDLATGPLPWARVHIAHADGVKCPRCWQWDMSEHPEHLCTRCQAVLNI